MPLDHARRGSAFRLGLTAASLALAVGLAAGAVHASDAPASDAERAGATPIHGQWVYRAFHEKEGIDRIIDDFVSRITTDPRIARRFEGANLVRLRLELKAQVCYLTGGPCEYGGKDMSSAHAGMNLRNRDFNALAEDLQISMTKEHVAFAAQNQLLAKLAPMQHQIVTR